MTDWSDRILLGSGRGTRLRRYPRWGLIVFPLTAILFQVYVPLFFQFLSYLELPLLVTVYFALLRRSPIGGMLVGTAIGLVQDSLSHQPIGLFGIVKTLVGYFAASIGMRFDVDHYLLRFLLGLFFFLFHQSLYWALVQALLGQQAGMDLRQTFFMGLLNAAVAVSLFHILDKLKERA